MIKTVTDAQKAYIAEQHKQNLERGMSATDSQRLLAKELGLTDRTIRSYCGRTFIPPVIEVTRKLHEIDSSEKILEVIEAERSAAKHKEDAKSLQKRVEFLTKELESSEKKLEAALAIKDSIKPRTIALPKNNKESEATAVIVASDWHYGAMIKGSTVNYLNEVTPEITSARIEKFFQGAVKLLKKEQEHVTIKKMVLALIGDFIENTIHIELLEDGALSPIQQMIGVENLIAGGIDYILKNTDLEEIIIPTCPGNHGRSTDERRIQSEYKNSYEQLMYWNLAKHFRDEPRVSFQVADSYHNYISVYDHILRFHHGHACKFGGGIGGLMIPMRKAVHRWNQQIFADTSICGHFHSLIVDYDVMINGSLVGPSAYSMRLGFPPERPQQIFRLLDSKRGWTVFAPILVAEQEGKSGKIIG